jgi:hypothetical protein
MPCVTPGSPADPRHIRWQGTSHLNGGYVVMLGGAVLIGRLWRLVPRVRPHALASPVE